MNKDMFKHAGIGGMAVTALLTILHIKQGGTADSSHLVAAGGLSLASLLAGLFDGAGGETKEITAIISMVKAFLSMTGTTSLKSILQAFKQFGIPVYFNGVISWGKGKSYPYTYGKNPEDVVIPATK